MVKRYSIAEAQSSLPGLVREVEGGARVELTREGRPVAMILSLRKGGARQEMQVHEEAPVIGNSLDHLIGRWSAQDEQDFLKAIEVFEQVDESIG